MAKGDRRTQAERAAGTREALVAAARPLFASLGFTEASLETIVRDAGVTRGALYHHFADKTELFAAVFEQVEGRWPPGWQRPLPPRDSPIPSRSCGCVQASGWTRAPTRDSAHRLARGAGGAGMGTLERHRAPIQHRICHGAVDRCH